MAKKPRVLNWSRTDLPSKPKDDYTGRDPERPRFFARVYVASTGSSAGRWFWTLAEAGLIDTGYADSVEAAVDAVEAAYVAWQAGSRPRD